MTHRARRDRDQCLWLSGQNELRHWCDSQGKAGQRSVSVAVGTDTLQLGHWVEGKGEGSCWRGKVKGHVGGER